MARYQQQRDPEDLVILEALRLSPREREIILEVMRRDEALRVRNQQRVNRLRGELQALRRRGALRPTNGNVTPPASGIVNNLTTSLVSSNCARCRCEFGRIINRGALCRTCRQRVCKGCRVYSQKDTTEWLCCVCHKHMEIQLATGEWINEYARRSSTVSQRRESTASDLFQASADVIKRTIRRSWTISNPQPRFSFTSDASESPEIVVNGNSHSVPNRNECQPFTIPKYPKRHLNDDNPAFKAKNSTLRVPTATDLVSHRASAESLTVRGEYFSVNHNPGAEHSAPASPKRYISPLVKQRSISPGSSAAGLHPQKSTESFVHTVTESEDCGYTPPLSPRSPASVNRLSPRPKRFLPTAQSLSAATSQQYFTFTPPDTPPLSTLNQRRPSTLAKAYSEEPKVDTPRPQLKSFSSEESQVITSVTNSSPCTTSTRRDYLTNSAFLLALSKKAQKEKELAARRASSNLKSASSFDEVVKAVLDKHKGDSTGELGKPPVSPLAVSPRAVSPRAPSPRLSTTKLDANSNIKFHSSFDSSGFCEKPHKTIPHFVERNRYVKSYSESDKAIPEAEDLCAEDKEVVDGDVEVLSGTLFRKVTVRRRRLEMKKSIAFDNGSSKTQKPLLGSNPIEITTELNSIPLNKEEMTSIVDLELKPQFQDGEEYKIVFINNSDSSSKEEEEDTASSISTGSSIGRGAHSATSSARSGSVLSGGFYTDDYNGDWDYFESSNLLKPVWSCTKSPFGSPKVYRRKLPNRSPIGSPIAYRKLYREYDFVDDESSKSGSDSVCLSNNLDLDVGTVGNVCKNDCDDVDGDEDKSTKQTELKVDAKHDDHCGSEKENTKCSCASKPPQIVAVPVLVPIPVPMTQWKDPTYPWNSSMLLYNNPLSDNRFFGNNFRFNTDLLPMWPNSFNLDYLNYAHLLSGGSSIKNRVQTYTGGFDIHPAGINPELSNPIVFDDKPAKNNPSESDKFDGFMASGDTCDLINETNQTNVKQMNKSRKRRKKSDGDVLNAVDGLKPPVKNEVNDSVKKDVVESKKMTREGDGTDNQADNEMKMKTKKGVNNESKKRKRNKSNKKLKLKESIEEKVVVDDGNNVEYVHYDGIDEEPEMVEESRKRKSSENIDKMSPIKRKVDESRTDETPGVVLLSHRKLTTDCEVINDEIDCVQPDLLNSSTMHEEAESSLPNDYSSSTDGTAKQIANFHDYVNKSNEKKKLAKSYRVYNVNDTVAGERNNREGNVNRLSDDPTKNNSFNICEFSRSDNAHVNGVNRNDNWLQTVSTGFFSDDSADNSTDDEMLEPRKKFTRVFHVNPDHSSGCELSDDERPGDKSESSIYVDFSSDDYSDKSDSDSDAENVSGSYNVSDNIPTVSDSEISDNDNGVILKYIKSLKDCDMPFGLQPDSPRLKADEYKIIAECDFTREKFDSLRYDFNGCHSDLIVDNQTSFKHSSKFSVSNDELFEHNEEARRLCARNNDENTSELKHINVMSMPSEVCSPTSNASGDVESLDNTRTGVQQKHNSFENNCETRGDDYNNTISVSANNQPRYTSFVMITQQDLNNDSDTYASPSQAKLTNENQPAVSVLSSETTKVYTPENNVTVQHTNHKTCPVDESDGLFSLNLEKIQELCAGDSSESDSVMTKNVNSVGLVTGNTLSAVICLEEGLADDDSWVEDVSHDEDNFDEDEILDTEVDSLHSIDNENYQSILDREAELRGYHRSAIDFTLHTIVEESCEESEAETRTKKCQKSKPQVEQYSELEKYFVFGITSDQTPVDNVGDDNESETSSNYSESIDSSIHDAEVKPEGETINSENESELSSSRLEKYFLSGLMAFNPERSKKGESDGSGSVGSDSEGHPSPEQRRKRLVRARGSGRLYSSSLDNLLAGTSSEISSFASNPMLNEVNPTAASDSEGSSTETDHYDYDPLSLDKHEHYLSDSTKRKKNKKSKSLQNIMFSSAPEDKQLSDLFKMESSIKKYPPLETYPSKLQEDLIGEVDKKQKSCDSGFAGSNDDLLKDDTLKVSNDVTVNEMETSTPTAKEETSKNLTDAEKQLELLLQQQKQSPQVMPSGLIRKDSFNNWSSDEETNLMMSKMRQFFKTMIANNHRNPNPLLNPTKSGNLERTSSNSSTSTKDSPKVKRNKPPQLVYFENELTRLMRTVPGLREDQVREIVEYLSSEDTWSDSYDSSDYTSSDLESSSSKSALQQQISDSCQEIINKFDESDIKIGSMVPENKNTNNETDLVYQKLVASFSKMTTASDAKTPSNTSPPVIAKVMHHIGSRLVALMHEVSSGGESPKSKHTPKKGDNQISSEDEDIKTSILPRSKSHDLLLNERPTSNRTADQIDERTGEASDCERFSWRGSFESALMATNDSRTKLSIFDKDDHIDSLAVMAAKRRSAGDLLFNIKSSREQLDRVKSCGAIGVEASNEEDEKLWVSHTPSNRQVSSIAKRAAAKRRSSVSESKFDSSDSEVNDHDKHLGSDTNRSTLPRSLQSSNTSTTNSLPRLPGSSGASIIMQKAQSLHHFLQNNVKSARYRAPGFNNTKMSPTSASCMQLGPKRAASAPGLHRRDVKKRLNSPSLKSDDASISETSSPVFRAPSSPYQQRNVNISSPNTPKSRSRANSGLTNASTASGSLEWNNNKQLTSPGNVEEDIDQYVAMHQSKSGLSSLGLRSESLASVYSGAGEGRYGTVSVRGQVEFSLQYNYKAGALEVHIKQCKDLASVDNKRNRSDPYVKVYLLPDKSKSGKRKTSVKKHTLNPQFDETLKFHMSLNSLETRTLWLTVWHSDMFGRNVFLGEVMIPFENKVFDDPTLKFYTLHERTEPYEDLVSYRGDIIVGLKFVPPDLVIGKKNKKQSKGKLYVLVKEAKNLSAVKANGLSDPFCKSYLLPDKGRNYKQKTPVIKRTCNPTWNYTFEYNEVNSEELCERALELTIWDHDRLASNEFLGGVRLSTGSGKHYGKYAEWMDSTGKEITLWQDMLDRPNFWVEGCIPLRSSLENHTN